MVGLLQFEEHDSEIAQIVSTYLLNDISCIS